MMRVGQYQAKCSDVVPDGIVLMNPRWCVRCNSIPLNIGQSSVCRVNVTVTNWSQLLRTISISFHGWLVSSALRAEEESIIKMDPLV